MAKTDSDVIRFKKKQGDFTGVHRQREVDNPSDTPFAMRLDGREIPRDHRQRPVVRHGVRMSVWPPDQLVRSQRPGLRDGQGLQGTRGRCVRRVSKDSTRNALNSLGLEELTHVKTLLTWSVSPGLKGMPFGRIEGMSYLELTDAIHWHCAANAAFVLYCILVQIGRRDLAEDLVSA
ncbi:hypothetical protein Q5P01_010555 [Channa striata]|uniref:Pyrin domain-containing protein n=1 Tax=Channa striata TaxID=64152 RepID=A0AA88SVP0_CHASR|nr:hypothetical protein Q5P01_010555 [Channa striata]